MEKMSFKKFYKFIVSKPFEIQPRYPICDVRTILSKQEEYFDLIPKLFLRTKILFKMNQFYLRLKSKI